MECVRQLILVPIFHLPADMGMAGVDLAADYIERLGRRHWDEYLALVENFWQKVRTQINEMNLDYCLVDLYQDGLPVCGKESEIVNKAAAAGSENYQLLLELMKQGAALMGTEDPQLLLEEYRNIQGASKAGGDKTNSTGLAHQAAGHKELLSKRDAYIGRRIGKSLRPGRTGLLFIGMMHNVEKFLPTDIVVRRLVPADE